MKKVRKAIIPAAGLGTRFLPATKALAKEMLPIVDKPTIQFIVEEARKSGIEDIVVVDGKNKRSIEDHFDSNPELEDNLKAKHKDEMLKLVQETTDINIYFIRQSHPRGLGDAVLTARDFIGDEPFVVMLGDDLNNIDGTGSPLTKELIDSYHETGASTLAVMRVPHEDTAKYGVINPSAEVKPGLFNVTSFVEKPDPADAPSDLAIIGRYIFTPEIFDVLAHTKPGKGNEVQLTDAIDTLNKTQRVFAHEFKGKRYDVGNKFGWIQTNIEYGLNHPQVKDDLRQYLKDMGAKLTAEDKKKGNK
ncbi:MAG: UTP--glucose-1-phosphate uridylyltransferase GalU [[Lactobacillus] timonensis]|jgi:UTP--glucose-1-phosphate uridylyltransferase|uniref:UTP--glucose-1-phosphate uridylyltransferase GalU n=1 Tax=[Lactobacillus] timonensis TaxID=1970790 RepID=UPI000C853D85|nr:UTP--glucose-1-phosphate uridylyltransferase GalU [[Lactobacillus] timonensis]MCI1287335.1 UTP--glucose-1-phosphate uridylyltransferase GalU [[Lactobacillus] timonensis]MCI1926222.1 UTP--glucose-1-phosphate uridylyltransferase GalU [[Lactobacillus] timonensis]MCI1957579.1 UTP--glucose-1-phosphate uridylyltransferase GalU [[Lactobacillus] timonensis]MCI1970627.1 UTP--glucose-1-phosphate uridylyltransferase GalU [[Lactobacillus] timonensis]MCI2006777.1 UTP--glucose-1-phosphate uridylyltransfe